MQQEFRYVSRLLGKKPAFTSVILLTLALGVGANTAIFSVVNQVLLSPLPLTVPEALLRIQEQHRRPANLTGATFHDLQERTRTIEHIMAYRIFTRNLTDGRQNAFPERMANRYYPGENPVGRMITMKDWGDPLPAQIVGIVGNVRQDSLESAPMPAVYFSFAQFPQGTLVTYLLAKTEPKPQSLMPTFRERARSLDRRMPVQVSTMQDVVGESLICRRFMLTLLASFAGLALLLAMSGIYGVVSYSVSQRTREYGIRVAMGAQRYQVLAMVVREGLRVTACGGAVGLIAALFVTRAMRSLVYGVSVNDPVTFGSIIALSLLVVVAASLAPAYRATKVDPIEALRYE